MLSEQSSTSLSTVIKLLLIKMPGTNKSRLYHTLLFLRKRLKLALFHTFRFLNQYLSSMLAAFKSVLLQKSVLRVIRETPIKFLKTDN